MSIVTFQKHEIAARLPDHGWLLVDRSPDDEWWVDEIWKIRSAWRPTALTLYLTFLVDPSWEGERRPDEGVWAVACTSQPMRHRMDAPDRSIIQVAPAWQREQPKLWRALENLRAA